ncbi:SLC13 family permease [Sphingomonas sp. LB3N6]|uniref:SLC13 family permease n=1 Tax=Sphingomonas fucosidasi TaxID=3096164 RepID=UPI002FC8B56D
MFTGIITDIGTIERVEALADTRVRISTRYDLTTVDLGASIACSGVCLTVVDKSAAGTPGWFAVDVSGETISRTASGQWSEGRRLNLERALRLGNSKRGWLPILILAVAMTATATGYVPVAVAFFAAAGLVMITGALPVREAYDHVEWPILIMLGALIPVSESLRTTGASDVIATGLAHVAATLPAWGAVALILVAAMAVTPFLNNAATVLVMAPIAAVFAHDLGYRPEAFLIATAIGAGCDFLTPIGHQCNTLVFGPGGYKFGDYARLGAPLSLLVVLVGTPLVMWTWPLH